MKNLLSYHPDTAGGVMSPDFVLVSFGSTVAHGLDAIRQSHASPENLHVVFVLDEHEKVAGHVTVVDLIRSNPAANVATIVRPNTATVAVDHDLDQVARKMSDFNLTVLPVVDRETGHVLGIITIDDVIDVLLPQGWRRDFGTEEAGQP